MTLGGGSALAEFPELCGVEANMISRCIRKEDKARFLELMRRYEAAANACGASISDNPSPGNIHDGLITDAIKSAGAAKKGGKAPISAVLDYAEPMPDAGLSLVCTPGNDVEAVTGLVAAGVNVVLFSTGLGTPTGNPIVPVIKVATNTAVAERLSDLIDFDCGPIIDGEPIAAAADRLLEKVLDGSGSMISCSGSARCRCSGRKGWGRDAFRRTGAPHGPLSSGKSSLFFEAVAVGGGRRMKRGRDPIQGCFAGACEGGRR